MIGLCCVLDPTSPSSGDPLKYFLRAYDHYSKVTGRRARMLCTRTMLITAAYQQAAGRYLSTSHVLMRAHFEVRGGDGGVGRGGMGGRGSAALLVVAAGKLGADK